MSQKEIESKQTFLERLMLIATFLVSLKFFGEKNIDPTIFIWFMISSVAYYAFLANKKFVSILTARNIDNRTKLAHASFTIITLTLSAAFAGSIAIAVGFITPQNSLKSLMGMAYYSVFTIILLSILYVKKENNPLYITMRNIWRIIKNIVHRIDC